MIVFTVPYNYISEDPEQLDYEEQNAVLNYFINPEALKIKQTYVDPESESYDYFGYYKPNRMIKKFLLLFLIILLLAQKIFLQIN